ncbi:MAG: YlxM family DNA-binding protein [Symbiobacteriaceae bacterium]|nr:YlxM family DNA-binding protein [Symbiobacteriaceae bacterium]
MSPEETTCINRLADIYASLLSKRQRDVIRLYFSEDYSLAEIAEIYGISRQAVHDALRRGVAALNDYEGKLHIARDHQQMDDLQAATAELIAKLPKDLQKSPEAAQLMNQLARQVRWLDSV